MPGVQATHDLGPDDAQIVDRPRRRSLFILGIAMLGLWFPVTFAGLINYWESADPLIALLLPNDEMAILVLLLWGLPGIPAVLLGYYGWPRPASE